MGAGEIMTSMTTRVAAVDEAPSQRASREDEERWVEAARAGDATAFRRIVEAHHRALYRMTVRMIGDAVEAEDLVQDSFAKAYVNLVRFDPSYRLSTWLHRIALNTCRDYLKSSRRRERAEPDRDRVDERAPPDEQVAAWRTAERVHAALARLKPSHREVIVLKDLEGLSYPEIREIVGSPITALKIRAIRARAKLRQYLEAEP